MLTLLGLCLPVATVFIVWLLLLKRVLLRQIEELQKQIDDLDLAIEKLEKRVNSSHATTQDS